MKITDIKATPVNIPFTAPYVFSYGSVASLTKTIVEVTTDDGVTGIGEIADGDRSADVLKLRERLLGLDIREITTAERRCVGGMRYTPWGDMVGQRRAFGGIEMAMWDARGKTEGVPLHVLLGGAVRLEIACQHRLLLARIADHDLAQTLLEIFERSRQTEDRHDLRGDGNVEARLAREAVGDTAERPGHDR